LDEHNGLQFEGLVKEDFPVRIGSIEVGPDKPFLIIAGPCVLESWDVVFNTARALKDLSAELGFSLVFKASYDKANRTSIDSFRGPGLVKGLNMLLDIKRQLGLHLLSDVHEEQHCAPASSVLDVLQIPAFLCRQTDLIVAAARTGKAVNIKKGQFVAPHDMTNSVKKVHDSGSENVFLTERGTTFGYNNLVVDFRSIPIMQATGCPVIFDATHSVQLPGGGGTVSGGQRQFVPHLAKAAVAVGCDGLFMEVHPNPDVALSDGPNQVPLAQVRELISQCLKVHQVTRDLPQLALPAHGQCTAALAVN
jgi:2-dehydro-3-deoxyphosphooctonate aldolase (KDO 8-P synthase)